VACTVLIAAPDLLPALRERAGALSSEVVAFSDADAVRALELITKRRPEIVALERRFSTTPRGVALINRIKADPTLTRSEIRVVSHDTEPAQVETPDMPGVADPPALPNAPVLDQRGTRRAPRFTMAASLDVLVDGKKASLIDLSSLGAQVVSMTILKPNQRVRVLLSDPDGTVRFNATVAWASFEIPPEGPRYRAGLEFIDADARAVTAYCTRHCI
jgi:hypothetical protein